MAITEFKQRKTVHYQGSLIVETITPALEHDAGGCPLDDKKEYSVAVWDDKTETMSGLGKVYTSMVQAKGAVDQHLKTKV